MSSLLISGGAGFIGTNFVRYWAKANPDDAITVLDAITYAGNKSNLASFLDRPKFKFVEGSICDGNLVERLFIEYEIDRVVHFAAESHVDRSIEGPDEFINTNIIGTYQLLKSANAIWSQRNISNHLFHHVSTDEVYGSLGLTEPAFSESNAYSPNSPYSASKAASDHLVRSYHHTYGLKTTTSNCSNNYGAYQFPEKLIPLCLINILKGKPLPIYGDGMQIRDWLHVDDHCRGIELIIKRGTRGDVYNIGGGNEWKNIDVVNFICEAVNELFAQSLELCALFPDSPCAKSIDARSLITYVRDRPGHDVRYAIDAGKIRSELGFSPSITFERGIKSTVKWYIDNQDWWLSILDKEYSNT
tara:strand:+ start:436 stop:1512 length:1077 start_codon:yes stop_codon:yes gene_type:complete